MEQQMLSVQAEPPVLKVYKVPVQAGKPVLREQGLTEQPVLNLQREKQLLPVQQVLHRRY